MPSKKNDRLSRVEKLVEKIAIEMRELREFQRETTEQIRELRELQKETDRQLKEAGEQIRELRESIRELGESQKKTDEQLRKTGEQTRKTEIQLCESDKKFNKVIDSWGIFVGDKVIPFAEEFLRKKGFSEISSCERLKVLERGETADYGPIISSRKGKVILLVSAKTHARSQDVDELLEDMRNFEFFMGDDYAGYTLCCSAILGLLFFVGVVNYV